MAYQGINTGTIPDDGTGDSLLDGAVKINDNFEEIYNLLGDGINLPVGIVEEFTAGSNVSISTSYGSVEISVDEITNIDITATSMVVSGVSTLGVVTGATYYGDGSNLTGIVGGVGSGDTANVSTNTLVVSGVSTLGSGVTVTGTTFTDQLSVSGISTLDSIHIPTGITSTNELRLGGLYDDRFFALQYNSFRNGGQGGGLIFTTSGKTFDLESGANFSVKSGTTTSIVANSDAGVELNYAGNTKFETTGSGVSVTGSLALTGTIQTENLNVTGVTTISDGRIQIDSSSNIRLGNLPVGGSSRNIAIGDQVLVSLSGGLGRNISIGELSYHDVTTGQYNVGLGVRAGQDVTTGSYNVIIGGYDGNTNLDIRTSSNNVVIADGEGNIRQYINSSGDVGIKTTIITEALTVAGVVSATSFYGTLNAGQLTGALPSLDGSALTGVTAVGLGVEIRVDGSSVGSASTIDFGNNIDVSFGSGIATVSTSLVGYATEGYVDNAIVGFITSSDLNGYATESYVSTSSVAFASTAGISSAVIGTINIDTTGIITASSFSGNGANLTNLSSAQLTGALPALDGSALTGVIAVGTGVEIHDDQVNVGSASTIDFGTGLNVTFGSGIATVTSSGGSGLQSRTVVSGSTTSIANNGIGNTDITGFKSYALMKVGLSTAGWLRIYTDSASRSADSNRSVGEDPSPGSGVIAEVVTTGISTTQIISPFVTGGNLDEPVTDTIYVAITNQSGTTQSITANLTILKLEE